MEALEQVQAPAPPTQPATINRPAQLPMPLRCRLCSPGCRGGPWGKEGGCPGRLYGLTRVSHSGAAGGYPLEISSRRFCQAIPVVPPRPVSAAATEYRSTECPARTLVKSASEPHSHGGCMEGKCRRVLVPPGHITLNLSGTRSLKKPGPGSMAQTFLSSRPIAGRVHGTVRFGPYPGGRHRSE